MGGGGGAAYSPMVSEMVLSSEGFPTGFTWVRPLVRVRPHVYEKVVGFGEVALAVVADELFLRSVDVVVERSRTCYILSLLGSQASTRIIAESFTGGA